MLVLKNSALRPCAWADPLRFVAAKSCTGCTYDLQHTLLLADTQPMLKTQLACALLPLRLAVITCLRHLVRILSELSLVAIFHP